jgi:hypothetical protein
MRKGARMARSFHYNPQQFSDHMMGKLPHWKPLDVYIGDDFAVFEFDFKYQCDAVVESALHWCPAYGYDIDTDGKDTLVIINRPEVD